MIKIECNVEDVQAFLTAKSSDRGVNAGACRDLISAIFANQKIAAIKAVRTMCGLGLREAKDLVEEFPNFRPGQY